MMDLSSKSPGQWRSTMLRSRVPVTRRMRFRPKEYTVAICILLLICYLASSADILQGAGVVEWRSAWNDMAGSTPLNGKPLPQYTHNAISGMESRFSGTPIQHVHDVQYREIFSLTPPDRKFFPINFSINFKPVRVIDPMILPHPTEYDMWVIIARRAPDGDGFESSEKRQTEAQSSETHSTEVQSAEGDVAKEEIIKDEFIEKESIIESPSPEKVIAEQKPSDDEDVGSQLSNVRRRSENFADEQLVCPAARWNEHDGWLDCIGTVVPLLQPATGVEACEGKLDARLFYGPDVPFLSYSSLQQTNCAGFWFQDARSVVEAFHFQQFLGPRQFHNVTRMHGLGSLQPASSNSFYFWDSQGEMYVQRSLFPQRVFAKLSSDGAVGEDLAPASKHIDQVCYGKYMPSFEPREEYLEQISNSLSITLCKRTDSKCKMDDTNTFIMGLFHLKSYPDESVYKPYVFLFRRNAPFAMHAIAARPLSVHGRTGNYSITSMSWKSHSRKYHGYMDDAIFLGLTIENSLSGTIDTVASDLLQDLGMC